MNKIFLVTLILGSIVAHANPELEHSSSRLGESKNYEAMYVNQDLTVSIVKPMFSNPTGDGSLYLSAKSDLNGVCRLYGLSSYVANSKLNYDASNKSVAIDGNSKFNRFEASHIYAIGTITCNSSENKPIPVSDNFGGRYINDDGTVTIKTPKFMMNNENFYFSAKSDLNGVCKLYGLSSYVANSKINYDANNESVAVDGNSKFNRFEASYIYAIDSLICR